MTWNTVETSAGWTRVKHCQPSFGRMTDWQPSQSSLLEWPLKIKMINRIAKCVCSLDWGIVVSRAAIVWLRVNIITQLLRRPISLDGSHFPSVQCASCSILTSNERKSLYYFSGQCSAVLSAVWGTADAVPYRSKGEGAFGQCSSHLWEWVG